MLFSYKIDGKYFFHLFYKFYERKLKDMSQVIDMTNQRYGKLVVLSRAENDKHGKAQWLCQCDCGNQKVINGSSLRKGVTVSCGCHKNQKLKEYNLKHTIDETGNRYGKLVVIGRNTDPEYQIDGRAM